ncbi:hypothetical protein AB1E33_04730 [Ruegeria sp. 2012CJ15-1]
MARHQNDDVVLSVCKMRGVVQADTVLALLYERISDPVGWLSLSVKDLVDCGQNNHRHVGALHRQFDMLEEEHTVISS